MRQIEKGFGIATTWFQSKAQVPSKNQKINNISIMYN